MLKYIFAAVVIILVWAAVILMEWPWWPAILVTVLVILVLVGLFLLRRWRARRAARELEKALAAQAAEQARSARPDLQAEVQEMQKEFEKAIGALKSSKLGKGGVNALYALPWYVIIGPPGSGKSTALRNSGLQFPYMSDKGGAVRGIGGTRNCDWWLTNDAVLLDTAGRWATEDEDREEWQAFLDLTKKFRPRKPLNGLLVAVSVSELGGAHEEEVVALAKRIRERVDEVMARLQMSLPVYVLWTKCDLVPGFVEMFNDLDRNSRGQIWGFTAPLTQPIGEPGQYFAEQFDQLSSILEQRALKRMGEERRIETRERVHEFPQQFQILRKNLSDFVSQLFSENVFQETPQFRGAYFTSGTQEGRPIDRLMSRMAEAFGIQGRVATPEQAVDPKSYFLRDVFGNVVFPDEEVAVRSAAEIRRQRIRQYAIAGAIFGIALLVCTLPAYAWYNSFDYLDETQSIAEAAASADPDDLDVATLDPLRDRTSELREFEQDGPPVSMRLGMYRGDDVYPALSRFYASVLRDKLVEPILSQDLERMNEFGRRMEAFETARPTPEEHSRYYDALKNHLLLTQPREEAEPGLTEPYQEWTTDNLVSRWAENADADVEGDAADAMRNHAGFYVELVADDDQLLFTRDDDAVRLVRNALNRVSSSAIALDQLITDMDGMGYEITLPRLLGRPSTALRAREGARVRGAFTRRAWDERVLDVLTAPPAEYLGEPWVLGRDPSDSGQTEEQLRELRAEYFRQYIAEWREFLEKVASNAAGGHEEALRLTQEHTRGEPAPLEALFQGVHYNTNLPIPEDPTEAAEDSNAVEALVNAAQRGVERRAGQVGRGAFQDAVGAMDGSNEPGAINEWDPEYVTQEFEGLTRFGVPPAPAGEGAPQQTAQLDLYLEQLQFVRDALQTYVDDPSTSDMLMEKLQTARTTVRGMIEEQAIRWRPNFEQLLWPPIDSAAENSSMALAMSNGRSWCNEVAVPWRSGFNGQYPFNPNGHDLPLATFTEFFLPQQGTLWAFYNEVLDDDVILVGNEFEFARRLGRDTNSVYQNNLTRFLTQANDVTTVFFPPGSEGPKVEFDVRIHPAPTVANTEFGVDEQSTDYENAPERWTRMVWPNDEAGERGAWIEIRGENGMHDLVRREGEWGLFRLLEAGTVVNRGAGVFSMTWRLHTHEVDIRLDFRPTRESAPFFGIPGRVRDPALMQPVRTGIDAPREIVVGKRACTR